MPISHIRLLQPSQAFHKVEVQSSSQGTSNPAQVPLYWRKKMKAGKIAVLVAAGLIAGTGAAFADETPAPTSSPTATAKPLTEYQKARAAYSAAVDAYIANRKSSLEQYKTAHAAYTTAKKAYNDARKPILETFKAELAAAKTARETAIAAATTPEAKLAANTAHKAAVAAATAKRDAAITALGAAPVEPTKPVAGARPTPPAKPSAKASKSS